jgi:hypothetical protein
MRHREENNVYKILKKLVKGKWTGIIGLRSIATKFGVP